MPALRADRVTFARESGVGTTHGPTDLVLCVGYRGLLGLAYLTLVPVG